MTGSKTQCHLELCNDGCMSSGLCSGCVSLLECLTQLDCQVVLGRSVQPLQPQPAIRSVRHA